MSTGRTVVKVEGAAPSLAGMVAELVWYGITLLVTVTVIAIGAYIGSLRALDTFYSEEDSIFLSENAGPRDARETRE